MAIFCSDQPAALPVAVCKKWGDAQEHWHGINDVPISNPTGGPIHAFVRRPARSFPRKLPPIEWATPRLRKEVMQVAEMLCGDVEKERIKDQIAHPDSLRGIHFDGEYGSGPYPGRPGHLECIDRNGTVSRVNVLSWEMCRLILGQSLLIGKLRYALLLISRRRSAKISVVLCS
eukprot:g7478.t1